MKSLQFGPKDECNESEVLIDLETKRGRKEGNRLECVPCESPRRDCRRVPRCDHSVPFRDRRVLCATSCACTCFCVDNTRENEMVLGCEGNLISLSFILSFLQLEKKKRKANMKELQSSQVSVCLSIHSIPLSISPF